MTAPITLEQVDGFKPGRLWSLWEIMHKYPAAKVAIVMGQLYRAATFLEIDVILGLDKKGKKEDAETWKIVMEAIGEANKTLSDLPLSYILRAQFGRLVSRAPDSDHTELSVLLREMLNGLSVEQRACWFLMITADKREFYEQKQPPFGDKAAKVFHEATGEIAAASRCFAVDEWTACVFHLMRVLEHGLRVMAEKVGFGPEAMAHENWKNIIDQIEARIREMEPLPKTPEKIERLKAFSEAAVQFRYFKDAWRNHVAHFHSSYDEHSATPIWIHVKAFMQQLAEASLKGESA